jgi:hypothetical protein
LALLSDQRLHHLLEEAPAIGAGIGGTSLLLHVDGTPVFVKQVPLTDLERQPGNVRSTANLFGLPVYCQYGIGSPSFGVWRELAAHVMTTGWVLSQRSASFPLMYHWRVMDGSASALPLSDELADVERMVEFWHGSAAVRRRLEAVIKSSARVALFLEYLPMTLPVWLEENQSIGEAERAIAMVEHGLRADVAFMNGSGLFHFDAHFDNILTDGQRLYFADFGLATSPRFQLSEAEAGFVAANATHDACHTLTRLVDWLVTNVVGIADWTERDRFVEACADGQDLGDLLPGAAAVIRRYAPVAVVINEFYRKLHLEDRTTPYPAAEVQPACSAADFQVRTDPGLKPGSGRTGGSPTGSQGG